MGKNKTQQQSNRRDCASLPHSPPSRLSAAAAVALFHPSNLPLPFCRALFNLRPPPATVSAGAVAHHPSPSLGESRPDTWVTAPGGLPDVHPALACVRVCVCSCLCQGAKWAAQGELAV